MKQVSLLLLSIPFLPLSLSSCWESAAQKQVQILKWEKECETMRAELTEIQKQNISHELPSGWEEKLIDYNEQRAQENAKVAQAENEIRQLKEQKDLLEQRFNEYKITHPME